MKDWSIRDAKDHLSALVDAAQVGPQAITRRGRRVAVVVSLRELERLRRRGESLTEFFARSGLDEVEIERIGADPRPIEL